MTELEERITARVKITGTCWIWQGALRNGYGAIGIAGKTLYTHRLMYELRIGPIPDDLVIDHLCRNPPCCNPDHMEAVTRGQNVLRGDRGRGTRVTQCHRGHPYTPDNTYVNPKGHRVCRTCKKAREQQYRSAA